jgi:hypothetical protein
MSMSGLGVGLTLALGFVVLGLAVRGVMAVIDLVDDKLDPTD